MLLVWYGAQVASSGSTEARNAGNIGMGVTPVSFTPRVGIREIDPITFAPTGPVFEPRPVVRFR